MKLLKLGVRPLADRLLVQGFAMGVALTASLELRQSEQSSAPYLTPIARPPDTALGMLAKALPTS